MIDLHVHIVPDVDDGPGTMQESLEMARQAAEGGVKILAATSHLDVFRPADAAAHMRRYRKGLLALRQEVRREGLPLKIVSGMEILLNRQTLAYAGRDLAGQDLAGQDLAGRWRLPGFRGGRRLLVEYAFDVPGERALALARSLQGLGYRLLLAHPERYDFIKADPSAAAQLHRMGVLLQINQGSLLRRFGERSFRAADWIIRAGLACAVASDAHDPVLRAPGFWEVRDLLELRFGPEAARELLSAAPARILRE